MAKKCPDGCTCGKHMRTKRLLCPPDCACGRHALRGGKPCANGCICKKHDKGPRLKCPDGCTCQRHQWQGTTCALGCTCARHTAGPKRAAKISAALKGRPLSKAHKEALKCAEGCTCAKHDLRNTGQYQPGSSGFNRPHSEETRLKLAQYMGERASSYKHGWAGTPTYATWSSMHSRCTDPRNASYQRYGGRGITVCGPWDDFETFLSDMGERPRGMTLDRINRDGNYEPVNCRWATKAEQEANKSNPWLDPEKAARIREGQRKYRESRHPPVD